MSEIRFGSPDGPIIDPHIYKIVKIIKNVTVEILEDEEGNQTCGWYRQPNSEEIDLEEGKR